MSSSWVILICEGDRPETMGKWSVYGITAHVRGTGEKKRRKKRKKRKKRKRKRRKKSLVLKCESYIPQLLQVNHAAS